MALGAGGADGFEWRSRTGRRGRHRPDRARHPPVAPAPQPRRQAAPLPWLSRSGGRHEGQGAAAARSRAVSSSASACRYATYAARWNCSATTHASCAAAHADGSPSPSSRVHSASHSAASAAGRRGPEGPSRATSAATSRARRRMAAPRSRASTTSACACRILAPAARSASARMAIARVSAWSDTLRMGSASNSSMATSSDRVASSGRPRSRHSRAPSSETRIRQLAS